jgi:methyltransferase (TIGR00027 family)
MLERLQKVIDPMPGNVTFVPADLNTQQLGDVLRAAGYDERAKTLFIWQGVTYFLRPEGIDRTLAFITNHSAPGSSVIFDYIYGATLRDTTQGYGKMLARAGKASGEPYVFWIDKGQVESFLTQRGFCEVRDMSLEDIKAKYFTGPNAALAVVTGAISIAAAKVCRAE